MAQENIDNKLWLWRPPEGDYVGCHGRRVDGTRSL
jgi:hypothetical protein